VIRPGVLLGIARAEARLTRRLVRFWVFAVLATLMGMIGFLNFFFIHRFASAMSASAAAINPRYFVGNFGANFLFLFVIGLVFLAFDVRARDRRERMSEVLDALPCSNLELILGKALGVFIPAWAAVVFIAALMQLVGWLAGSPIEPRSLFTFVFLMAIPTYVFTIGMVYFLTLLVRHRLLASLLTLAVIVIAFFGTLWWVPFYAAPGMDVTGGYTMPFPSDIVGKVISGEHLVQRLGFLLAGLGLLWLAAAVHPRKDDASRGMRAAAGVGGVLAGAALLGFQVVQAGAMLDTRDTWKALHESRQHDPTPDLQSLSGEVRIDPGRRLELRLELTILAREGALQSALFSLNPALEIEGIEGASGQALNYEFDQGLLEVTLPVALRAGEQTTLGFAISGTPGAEFAYLDSAVEILRVRPVEAQIGLLGYDPLIFDRRFVALMPGVRWLPATGAEIGRADANVRPADFFSVDLTVDLPEDWLVGGPGRRREAAGAEHGRVRFRFAPTAPVPEVALVAAAYESYQTEVGGVLLEALIHPSHLRNVELFETSAGEIREWLTERLDDAAELGLAYPYDALTLAEVPLSLRGYGGGWRMDTTLAQPALILMRESSFPTARFDVRYGDPEDFQDREGGLARAQLEGLERFFESDFNGGNLFLAASRSFFGFQTAGRGPEGVPLDFVWEMLMTRLLMDKVGYFSIHLFDQKVGEAFINAGQQMRSPERVADSFSEVMIHMLTSRSEVWETLLDVSLAGMDPWADPERTINVLSLKGGAMARSLLDYLGREKAGELLAILRSRTTGESFDREDVLEAGREIGEDLELWLDTWIDGTELPGFVVGGVVTSRIADDEDGAPRYQTTLTIVNDEATAGLLRVDYRAGEGDDEERGSTEPVRVPAASAMEIGVLTSKTPRTLRVFPYLALNREPFTVRLPPLDEEKLVDAEPFVGAREVEWTSADASVDAIVVDDLDDGFTVVEIDSRGLLRFGGAAGADQVLDRGLPVNDSGRGTPTRWSRRSISYAYGKYRHTAAIVRSGDGERKAVFSAEIPRAGRWELEWYLPKRSSAGSSSGGGPGGSWQLSIVDSSGDRDVTFDAAVGEAGWNSLGLFDLTSGRVRVELSDATEGRYVYADAIRWTPVRNEVARSMVP